MAEQRVIAVDLGAESGRVIVGSFDGEQLHTDEVHRFSNGPVRVRGTLHWDALRLWSEITDGIAQVEGATSIGVDSWGVDLALLDNNGHLLSNPIHYRDDSTTGAMEWTFERMPQRAIFERTGVQFMRINGLYRLAAYMRDNSSMMDAAHALLTIADLFNYWLSGSQSCEFTELTSTQLYNPTTDDWAREVIAAIGVPERMLTPIVKPGTKIGQYDGLDVIVPCCHDTASAVVGVPTTTKNFAYLSSGTWSLLGLELPRPVINDATFAANLTNEGGYGNTFRLLKNIMGLWLAQQCRHIWSLAGHEYDYSDLVELAEGAEPFRSMIDPDMDDFLKLGDHPAQIQAYCAATEQYVPQTHGEIVRTIYESLALKYRVVLDTLIAVSGQQVDHLHIIGGGSQNALLCQMTANATGRTVIAGPAEATALGNIIVQLIAQGELGSLAEARQMLSRTVATEIYHPQAIAAWEEQVVRYKAMLAS